MKDVKNISLAWHAAFVLAVCLTLYSQSAQAQIYGAGGGVYNFLGLPVSSRIASLGGENVAIRDGELTSAMLNPALLGGMTHQILSLNYSYYLPGTMGGTAIYGHNFGRAGFERQPEDPDKPNYFAAGIQYLDYGKMPMADAEGNKSGTNITAKDIQIDLVYARQLGRLFSVGVALKPVMSFYESYSAFALAADVGGHFQTRDSALHVGLALRNVGWQLKGFYSLEGGQRRESLPLNLEVGIAYRIKHAPLRLSMTIHDLQRWDLSYEVRNMGEEAQGGVKWYDMLFRHTVFALDIVPKSERFYLTLSYNHRHRAEMQLRDQRSLAGFAIGAGVRIKMLRLGFAFSQYTKSNFTYQASLSFDINSMLK